MGTLAAAIELWLARREAGGLSASSIRQYRSHLNSLLSAAGREWPDRDALYRWQTAHQYQAKSTRHHKAKTCKAFFAWALDEGLIASDPALRLEVPRRAHKLPQMLTQSEFNQIREGRLRLRYRRGERHLVARDKAIFQLMALTGLRRGEVSALNVGDVAGSSVAVQSGKGERGRVVPIPKEVSLLTFTRGRRDDDPLFTQRRSDKRLTARAIGVIFERKLSDALGRKVHPHMLRHAYATWLCRRNTPLPYIQRALGHASLATTQVYIDVTAADLRDAIDRAFGEEELS